MSRGRSSWEAFRVFVVGCGSIGRRHLANLKSLGIRDLIVHDSAAERAQLVVGESGVRAVSTLAEGLDAKPVAVVVCTPPHMHVQVARDAVMAGADVLIEKPISDRLEGLEALVEVSAERGRVIMVGYNLRFHRGLRRMRDLVLSGAVGKVLTLQAEFGYHLASWRPKMDYRKGYFASENSGGGVLLDVSHEIDYVRWIAGEVHSVYAVAEHVSPLEIDTEDVAFLSLRFAGGHLGQVSLDCLQPGYSRWCKVTGSEGALAWEHGQGLRSWENGAWREIEPAQDIGETYLREMEHFLACVQRRAAPSVDGIEGMQVLRIVLAAKESARLRREVTI
ncbi:MAG: Gfo/Idh/MocA family oxidoreductase [Nitrospira sp.]|nr:Gfo/Idh/MocA family oxidoreductase [Nitrospira sp.]